MISFTLTDIEIFLKSLPPSHVFNMGQNVVYHPDECGCILIQFGRKQLNFDHPRLYCGFRNINTFPKGKPYSGKELARADEPNSGVYHFILRCLDYSFKHNYTITAEAALKLLHP